MLINTKLQRCLIDALDWFERSSVSITLACILAVLVVLIGLLAAYQQ